MGLFVIGSIRIGSMSGLSCLAAWQGVKWLAKEMKGGFPAKSSALDA